MLSDALMFFMRGEKKRIQILISYNELYVVIVHYATRAVIGYFETRSGKRFVCTP